MDGTLPKKAIAINAITTVNGSLVQLEVYNACCGDEQTAQIIGALRVEGFFTQFIRQPAAGDRKYASAAFDRYGRHKARQR